jgi:hypothetical protein
MTTYPAARRQRGVAALIVTLMLFFAMVLTAVFVNRNLLVEQHSAANHERATQAFEAAEAGIEWALAQLNNPQRLGVDCAVSAAADASAFRTRYLRTDMRTGLVTPIEWADAGVARPLRASSARSGDGWTQTRACRSLRTRPQRRASRSNLPPPHDRARYASSRPDAAAQRTCASPTTAAATMQAPESKRRSRSFRRCALRRQPL